MRTRFFGQVKEVKVSGKFWAKCNLCMDTPLCIYYYRAVINRSFEMAYHRVVLCNVNTHLEVREHFKESGCVSPYIKETNKKILQVNIL